MPASTPYRSYVCFEVVLPSSCVELLHLSSVAGAAFVREEGLGGFGRRKGLASVYYVATANGAATMLIISIDW